MTEIPPTTTLSGLRAHYDVFFIDQFGVLRDGEKAYADAPEALSQLKQSGARIIILSNSGRSGEYNAERLTKIGFARSAYDAFVTSGDVAVSLIENGDVALSRRAGTRCFTLSSGRDRNLSDRMGWEPVKQADQADIIVISGSETERISMVRYGEMLAPAAQRGIPCICTNPDREKLSGGTVLPSAGALADLYEHLGGEVTRVGKPYGPIYHHAHGLVGYPDRKHIVCIGDSPDHDIAGANGYGLASVLSLTGVSAQRPDQPDTLLTLNGPTRPNYIMTRFS
nr:TIGR01459 family HAD-type hydrolase [Marinicella sp. W31]MDC2880239.1 TIGR01459 family HAD-type hydrolase [Marinicella sp. W31]